MAAAKKALGKGLGALIAGAGAEQEHEAAAVGAGVVEIDVNSIEPNKNQPRKYFDDEALRELADSLSEFGVIQPIIVKQEDGYYSIVAGERRWRAARLAGLRAVPAIVKDYAEVDMLQIALIENIQRQDLNPIEEAMCYKRLVDEYFFTQEDIAAKLGKSRNSISYAMSLLNLDERVQNFIAEGKLTAGHGRPLGAVKDAVGQFELAERAIECGASVRETEKMVKAFLEAEKADAGERPAPKPKPAAYAHVENDLRHILGTKVSLRDGKDKGVIEIEYYSPEELDRLVGMFKKIDARGMAGNE